MCVLQKWAIDVLLVVLHVELNQMFAEDHANHVGGCRSLGPTLRAELRVSHIFKGTLNMNKSICDVFHYREMRCCCGGSLGARTVLRSRTPLVQRL